MSQNSSKIHRLFFAFVFLFFIGYGVFNSRFLIKGPELTIQGLEDSNKNILYAQTKDFVLQGTATHSSFITVNNRPIFIDESGNFNEKLLLSNGVSLIDVYAKDKFGKEIRKKIDVVYEGEDSSALVAQYTNTALRSAQASSTEPEVDSETEQGLESEPLVASIESESGATSSVDVEE